MSRGRLEIFSPDGPVQSYFLDKDTTAIGRSVGNDLVLDRHGISRYHVTLTAAEQQAIIKDLESVNGTYVDGIRLEAHQPRTLRGGEEIQIGDVRLIFYPPADLDTTMQTRIEIMEADTFRAELEGPNIAITPGSHAPATLKIENTSQHNIHLSVSIDGIPKEWVRLDRHEFDLEPGKTTQIGVNFKPLRRPDSTPGDYPFTVNVNTPASSGIELQSRLQIQQYNGYGVVMGTPTITEDQNFQVYIQNQGNGPLKLRFHGLSRQANLRIDLHPPQIALAAGERKTIIGHINPLHRPLVGKPQTYRYDIISQSLDAAGFQAPVSGEVQIAPLMPQQILLFAIPAILVIGAVFALLIIALLGGVNDNNDDDSPPISEPVIVQFDLNANAVSINTPILVSWHTQESELPYLEIKHDGEIVDTVELPGIQGNGHAIPMNTAGRYEVTLVAQNADRQATQSNYVLVRPQVTMTYETIPEGTRLYRNLQTQQIDLEWDILWTTEASDIPPPAVYLNSPDLNINSREIDATSTTLTVPLLEPPDTININLLVIGPDDVQTNATVSIMVSYPECTTLAPQADVFQGPSEQYPLRGALPPNVSLQINGRAAGRDWLVVPIPQAYTDDIGLFGWIQLNNLNCRGFDPAELIVIPDVDLPPLPTAEPDE